MSEAERESNREQISAISHGAESAFLKIPHRSLNPLVDLLFAAGIYVLRSPHEPEA